MRRNAGFRTFWERKNIRFPERISGHVDGIGAVFSVRGMIHSIERIILDVFV